MTALADDRSIDQAYASLPSIIQQGVDAGACLYTGAMVCALSATGMLTAAGAASTGAVVGIASAQADNSASGTSDGDISCNLLQGVFRRANSGTAALTDAYFGLPCYAEDDQTLRNAGGATYPLAGIFLGFDDDDKCLFLCSAGINYLLSQAALAADLAATTSGLGASKIGVYDVATNFVGADVEAVLAEIMTIFAKTTTPGGASKVGLYDAALHWTATNLEALALEIAVALKTAQGCIEVPLSDFCLAAGTPLAAYSSDPTPGYAIADSGARCIKWGSHATPTEIWGSAPVPNDLQDTAAMTLHIMASKSGATLADATTFTVTAFFQTVGALHDADADCGGVSSAMVGDATAKTVAELTLAIAHGDVPPAPANLSFTIQPTDGELGTDDIYVHRIWFEYTKKIMTS